MSEDPRAKVIALIELAVGKGTPPHEASAAAMAACRKIKAEGLLLLKFVEETSSEARKGEFILVDIPFLVMGQSATLYRVARLDPPKRHSSAVFLIPKEFVESVVMMNPEEVLAIGWRTSSVIKSMRIDKIYFEQARQKGWDRWR